MASKFTPGQRIKARYYTNVYKPEMKEWRDEPVEAVLVVVSPGMAVVEQAVMFSPGSKRQSFNIKARAKQEIGKRKRISSLKIL